MNTMTRIVRGGAATVSLALLVTTVLVATPGVADAASHRAWNAKIGSGGANGVAAIYTFPGGIGAISLMLNKLPVSTSLTMTLNRGTCTSVGPVLFKLSAIKSSRTGTARRTSNLTTTQAKILYALTGRFAIRVAKGSFVKCGMFAAVAGSSPPPSTGGISQLQPFVPAAIWGTCTAYSQGLPASAIVGVHCAYTGVDDAGYDLFRSNADLQAVIQNDITRTNSVAANGTLTCTAGNGNVYTTWEYSGQTANPDQLMLCYRDNNGAAWIEQADPATNVIFTAEMVSGNLAALDQWWLTHDTVVEPGAGATPTPTPTAWGTVITGTYFSLAVPPGWSYDLPKSGDDPNAMAFSGPGTQGISAYSVANNLTLDEANAQIAANIKAKGGGDPEQTEDITIGGVPARLLTYHFVQNGSTVHHLDALFVHNGRGYEITFGNVAGSEAADRALFLKVVASFAFTNAGG